ncbi:hypothetical protein JYT31_00815 [Beggiatoa alba]|nr:hypothetical protein [Beggiatoa alba]
MIEGISHPMLCHYVAIRQKIDAECQLIYSLSHLLASFEKYAVDGSMDLDPLALGHVHQIINNSVLNIGEQLDDFIYLHKARESIDNLVSTEET